MVFMVIGVALIFEVVGLITNHPVFWFFFIAFYIIFVFVFTVQVVLKIVTMSIVIL